MKVALYISLTFGLLSNAYSQDLQVLLDSSEYYWNVEQYTKAYGSLNQAVEGAKKYYEANAESSAANYAYILNLMGSKLYQSESFEVAASYFDAAIPIYKELQGEFGDDYLICMSNLAMCYENDSDYENALIIYNYLLSNEKYVSNEGKNLYQAYNKAGICAYQVDNYEVAKDFYQKALALMTEKSQEYWVIMENFILLENDFAQYAEGYKLLEPFLKKYPNKESEYTNLIAYYHRDMGNAAFEEGNYPKTVVHLKKTLKYLVEVDSLDRISKVYALQGLSAAFVNSSQFKESIPYLENNEEQVAALYGELSDDYIYALNYLSLAHTEMANFKAANKYFKKAYRIIDKMQAKNMGEMRALFDVNYGDYMVKLGKYSDANFFSKRALDFYNSDPENYFDDIVYSTNQLGLLLVTGGKYEKAEAVLKQALSMQNTRYGLENEMSTKIASNLTSLYIQTGRGSRASQFLSFILSNDYKLHGDQSMEYSYSLQVAGVLYTTTGQPDFAIDAFNKSYEIRKKLVGDENREVMKLKQSLGSAYIKAGKLEEAENILSETLALQKKVLGSNNLDIALTQNDLARVYYGKKNYPEALRLFKKSYDLNSNIYGQYNQFTVSSLYNMACTELQEGKVESAFGNFNKAMKNYLFILDEYFPYLSEKERLEYYHTITGQLEAYYSFLNSQLDTHPEFASVLYNTQIKTKSILLSESMKLRNFLSNHKDENVKNAYKKWTSINKEIAKMGQINLNEEKQAYLDSIKIVGEEFERVLNSLPGISAQSQEVDWKAIAAQLKNGEVAIELIRIKHFDFENNKVIKEKASYLALLIDNKTTEFPKHIRLEEGFDMDSKYFNMYKNAMNFKIKDEKSYSNFWKLIADKVAGYDKIYLSSDGVYHLLNLNTLYNTTTSKYVISESNIEIVGNTIELLDRKVTNEKPKDAILFGFPNFNIKPDADSHDSLRTTVYRDIFTNGISDLPGTKIEIDHVNKLMSASGIKTKTHISDDAHEQQLKNIGSVDILHIATHGFFEESTDDIVNDDPLMHSGLLLANIKESASLEEENGIITAKEVAQFNLQDNKLVVLSACETGRGKVVDGQGVYGLQRAFQVAGADNVIISLWKVDDTATQLLMGYFYEEYLQSNNPRTALKISQIKLQEQYPHPNYWGAFYVIGQ